MIAVGSSGAQEMMMLLLLLLLFDWTMRSGRDQRQQQIAVLNRLTPVPPGDRGPFMNVLLLLYKDKSDLFVSFT
jgi:hypothetical protein